jgi:hypothetical protein
MKKLLSIAALAACCAIIAGCGASGGSPQPNQNVANVGANVLQFAVGTANLYGTATALNVVVTYRQPSNGYHPGDSGTLLNSPTLTLPAALGGTAGTAEGYDGCSTAGTGAAPSELGSTSMKSTGQQAGEPCATTQTTFGQSGGAFATGLEPFNSTAAGDYTPPLVSGSGKPFQVAPYPVPLYASNSAGAAANSFVPWGGPPAFEYNGLASVVGSATVPAGTAGVEEGIDVFAGVAPVAGGTYTLALSVPANTGTVNVSKSFTLTSAAPLGTATAATFTADGTGGGTFDVTMPTGATEAFVEVEDTTTGVYYTMEASTSGATSTCGAVTGGVAACTLKDNEGPPASASSTTGSPSTAAGDKLSIWTIGFDYPAYEINPLISKGNPNPAIVGTAGQDDVTISAVSTVTVP